MTRAEIDAARARLESRTSGQWSLSKDGPFVEADFGGRQRCFIQAIIQADAAFCAHAPDDLRKALDALDRLRELADCIPDDEGISAGMIREAIQGGA